MQGLAYDRRKCHPDWQVEEVIFANPITSGKHYKSQTVPYHRIADMMTGISEAHVVDLLSKACVASSSPHMRYA